MDGIGPAVLRRRTYLNLSQPEAARVAGLSVKTWWAVEHDQGTHHFQTMASVFRALAWNIADLNDFIERGVEPRSTLLVGSDQTDAAVGRLSAQNRAALAAVLDLLTRYVAGK
jgi:transcriptional regulator with XRE-family HTH domain